MKNKHIDHMLIDYLENELSSEMRELVDAHLNSCSDCAKEEKLMRQTFAMLEKDSSGAGQRCLGQFFAGSASKN